MSKSNNQISLSARLICLFLTLCLAISSLAAFPVAAENPETETVIETTPEVIAENVPDLTADLETSADWEASLPKALSGKWGEDLLAVASSQLGYRESEANYIAEAEGYNRYGAWYASFTQDAQQAYRPWNVTFLFFCIYYSKITDFPLEETCADWVDSLEHYELFRTPDSHTPAAGDLIFLDTDGDSTADRAGIVKAVSDGKVSAIEGDVDGAVAVCSYDLTDTAILGYGDLAKAMGDAVPENSDIATLPSWNTGDKLYLDLSRFTGWEDAGAQFLLFYRDSGNGEHKTPLSKVADHLYRIEIPSNLDKNKKIRFARKDPNSENWWNATDELALPTDGKNSYQVTGWGNTSIGTNNGEWATYDDGTSTPTNPSTPTVYFSVPTDWTNSGYTLKIFAQYGADSNAETILHALVDTGYLDSEGRKIYRYDFHENECPYGGFYRIYFQAFNGSTWVAEYKALDCSQYNDSTWTDAATVDGKHYKPGSGWGPYSPSTNPDIEETDTLPAVPAGKRRIFFDATLSALSYDGEAGAYEIPQRGTSLIYCWAGQLYTMTKLSSSFQSGGRTWSNLYYVDIPSSCNQVTFASFALTSATNYGGHGESTTQQTIPSNLSQPCFYADSSDMSIYGGTRGGYWDEVFSLRDAQKGKNKDAVDIKQEAFQEASDTYYINTTFYDYFTDYELNGSNRDSYDVPNGASVRNWYPFRHFNLALSDYYRASNVKIPLYAGHFQPQIWGIPFKDIEKEGTNAFDIYGFDDGLAYGNNGNTSETPFMSVNNGYQDVHGNQNMSDHAAQGLVYNQLTPNGTLLTSQGETASPFFNEAFLTGTNSKNAVLAEIYHNVHFPFTKKDVGNNGVDYWVFDSEDTTVALQQDPTTKEYYLKDVGRDNQYKNVGSDSSTNGISPTYGFFPFNATSSGTHANTYNYGFGCRIDLTFRLTEDGKVLSNVDTNGDGVPDKRVPIEFTFAGDDDVWIFIDGKLALDVGGGHSRVDGTLDFSNMTATVSKVKDTPGTRTPSTFTIKGNRTDEHTLTMFYMERGMWSSNMHISFNFPDENQLEVGKQVDTSDVNDLFKDVFDDQSLFTFNIKNLATHFEEVSAKGDSHEPIVWDIAGSTLSKHSSSTFSRGTYHGRANALHWYAQHDDANSEYRSKRFGVLALPNTVDISSSTKLSFDIYVEDDSGFSLSKMYLDLLDSSVGTASDAMTAGYTDALGCNGTYLSGKTYGSTSTSGNSWVTVTLDLSKLTAGSGFDLKKVKYLRFGYDQTRNIYLSNIVFQPAAVQGAPTGFITQQYDVPSYGSANSGVLENAAGAVYTSNMSSGSSVVDDAGRFALENGEVINFHDQFRRGSYIYLEEILSQQEKALFKTSWTMYENGSAVTAFGSGNTLTNPAATPDMTDVAKAVVTDSRIEKIQTGSDGGHNLQNAYQSPSNPNSFLFRSYATPDSTELTTKLKVVFTNEVKTNKLTITKADKQANTTNKIDPNEAFTFIIEFFNVGGLGLESKPIITTVALKAGESHTINGIPRNTQYRIYELKTNKDVSLDSVSGDHTSFEAVTYSGTAGGVTYEGKESYRVSGSLSADRAVTFTNEKKPVISLQVTKNWRNDAGGTLDNPPATIYLRLQYRVKGSGSTWSTHPSFPRVAFTPGYGSWTYTFTPLNQYDDYTSANKQELEYRAVELTASGTVVTDSITIDSKDYAVTYGSPSAVVSGVATQTITNQLQSKIRVSAEKRWVVPAGVTTPPVEVQLQRRVEGGDFTEVSTVTLNPDNGWKYIFEDLPVKDSSGKTYEYQVVEMTHPGVHYVITRSHSVSASDSKLTEWVITNTLIPKVTLSVTKRSSVAPNPALSGATFLLEGAGISQSATTDANGQLSFTGLKEGTYTLRETAAPSGYNLLTQPITILIAKNVTAEGVITYTASVPGYADASLGQISERGIYTLSLDIYNKPTIVMPATGGVNGFEFWILGGLGLMALPMLMLLLSPRKPKGKYLRK